MNAFDIIVAALLIFMMIRGLLKGGITELSGIGALIVGIGGAAILTPRVSALIEAYSEINYANIVAFIVCFLLIYVALRIVGVLLRKLLEHFNLTLLDRALGIFVGLAEGFLVILTLLIILLLLQSLPLLGATIRIDSWFEGSLFYPFFKSLVPLVLDLMRDRINGV